MQAPSVFGIPVDFILFGLTLAGVAVFHKCTMRVALTGLVTIAIYKIAFTGFKTGAGVMGFISHVGHEWVILVNLLCLLMGFALLSQHFEKSQLPLALPKFLPHDWKGGFVLLVMVWVLSSFLDNIAAALIGGAMAHQLFRGKVHIGYLAAIVAASNAGGSWSVVGDTTTTMMWIAGVTPSQVFEAITAATVALLVFGIPAAIKQHRHSPILKRAHERVHIDWMRDRYCGADPRRSRCRKHYGEHKISRAFRQFSIHRRRSLGGDRGLHRECAVLTGKCCREL